MVARLLDVAASSFHQELLLFSSADWQYMLLTRLAPDKCMGREFDLLDDTLEAVSRFFLTDASEVKITYISVYTCRRPVALRVRIY